MTTHNPFTPSRLGIAPGFHPPRTGDGMPAPVGQPVILPPVAPVSLLSHGQGGGGGGPADCPT
jgi:hypothetical protein